MASCNDLDEQLKQIDAELEALESLERGLKAQADLADGQPKQRRKILRTYTGDEVRLDPGEWVTQAELDAMRMGDQTVQDMVAAGFNGKQVPNGRTGRMINYGQLDPSQENLGLLLEVMGLKRAETAKGVELKRPFTNQAAAKALMTLAQEAGGDPRAVATALQKRVRGIDNLPSAVFASAKAKWDSATQYTDVLEELAEAMEGGYLTAELKHQAGNVAKWAHLYEQLDAQIRRRVGQSLKAMQFKQDAEFSLIDVSRDIQDLTLNEITGNTLVGDMLKMVDEGNAKALRQMAAAKRADQALGITQKGFYRDLSLLNSLRRANLLSSFATWAVRNPLSGALVQGIYMAEDMVSGSLRMAAKNGLRTGVADELKAAGFAGRAFVDAFSISWGNFSSLQKVSTWGDFFQGQSWGNFAEALATGKTTVARDSLKYVESADELRSSKAIVNAAFDSAWEDITSIKGLANPVSLLNFINGGFWKVFGGGVERLTGSDAGYMAPFRILNATDDFMQTQAFAWKTSHEAFVRAAEEGRAAGKDVGWIERRADELASSAMFDGVFTDDDLVQYRKARNAEYGIPVGEEIPDDELRAMLYNQLKGVPNTETDLGRLGLERAQNSTFTGEVTGMAAPFVNGVQQMRSNPLMGWALPFWKVPINGIGWVLNREVITAVPKQLLMEGQQLASKNAKFTVEEMADARARTAVAVALAGMTHVMWENGFFTDGGSLDVRQREREGRNWKPYSFSMAGTLFEAAKFQGSSIDVIDLMGLHADVLRAYHDGILTWKQGETSMVPILMAYANLIKNKAALKNITSIMNWAQDPQRYDFGRVLGDQMGGLLPLSGFGGSISRSFSDAEETMAKRRMLSANEVAALKNDPNYRLIQPVINALQSAGDAFVKGNAGLLGGLLPREKDWLGNSIQRPLGLPVDLTIPFMPVIKPQDPLYQWLEKHGFGDKPRPDGKFEHGGVSIQMTNQEEDFYRDTMRTVKGEYAPEDIGMGEGKLLPIAQYVQGNDLQGALRQLMRDPRYNELLNNPAGGISPSLTVQKGKSLAARKQSGGGQLYAPVDEIINYYDRLALMKLLQNQDFSFADRFRAVNRQKQEGLQQWAESLTPLGVGRL
jgi:hypothetical protein